jgi:hypothetical protein
MDRDMDMGMDTDIDKDTDAGMKDDIGTVPEFDSTKTEHLDSIQTMLKSKWNKQIRFRKSL